MKFNAIDLVVIILFFLVMLVIGVWSYFKSRNSEDYFVAGGNLPWWLAGISHHVS
jgi:SSS family solute:Na+ symporter